VLLLDVGHSPDKSTLSGNFYDLRQDRNGDDAERFKELVGVNFESLHNVFRPYLNPKLKAPRMRFVTSDVPRLSPVTTRNFDTVMSFAAGGLANAWGAGLYRYDTRDLAGFPIVVEDLEPYYDAITAKIGISGVGDDLSQFFGPVRGLQPPLELDAAGSA